MECRLVEHLVPHVLGFGIPPQDLVEVRQPKHCPSVPASVHRCTPLEGKLRLLQRRLEHGGGGREAL